MISQYDLASSSRHSPATLAAWARGEHVAGLPRLSLAEASVLLDSWEWNAPVRFGPCTLRQHEMGEALHRSLCAAANDPSFTSRVAGLFRR